MKFKIPNHSNLGADFAKMLKSLTLFAKKEMGINELPSVYLKTNPQNAEDTLGKTAYYNPELAEIHVFVDGRHAKDILRSVAHELVHHMQNEKGSLSTQGYHGDGYAQKNPHLRDMEKEAYLKGNMCFRDWEDSYKETNYSQRGTNMSLKEWKNSELNRLMMKKFGLLKEDTNVEEAHCGKRDDEAEELEEAHCGKRDDELEEGAKPDFLDLDKDGDKEEPMKQAAKDAKKDENLEEIIYQEVMKMLGGE